MVKAIWNKKIIARSNKTIELEGNHYFPLDDVNKEFLEKSETTSRCPWKGNAKYYNLHVDGKINSDAAWYYPEPNEAAKEIKGYVAFWNGVLVE